jgi:hypothetical protein
MVLTPLIIIYILFFLLGWVSWTKSIKILCEADKTLAIQAYERNEYLPLNGYLPLHFLLNNTKIAFTSDVSIAADCFRYLLLRLHPAAASTKNDGDDSPYTLAVQLGLDDYFIRLLLNADLTIDPERRLTLNYAARKEAMFLIFRAINRNKEPSAWITLREPRFTQACYFLSVIVIVQ